MTAVREGAGGFHLSSSLSPSSPTSADKIPHRLITYAPSLPFPYSAPTNFSDPRSELTSSFSRVFSTSAAIRSTITCNLTFVHFL